MKIEVKTTEKNQPELKLVGRHSSTAQNVTQTPIRETDTILTVTIMLEDPEYDTEEIVYSEYAKKVSILHQKHMCEVLIAMVSAVRLPSTIH